MGGIWIRQPHHNCSHCRHVNKQGNENNECEIPTVTLKLLFGLKQRNIPRYENTSRNLKYNFYTKVYFVN